MLNGGGAGGAALHMACGVRRWSRTEATGGQVGGQLSLVPIGVLAATTLHQEHPRKGRGPAQELGSVCRWQKPLKEQEEILGLGSEVRCPTLIRQETSVGKKVHV